MRARQGKERKGKKRNAKTARRKSRCGRGWVGGGGGGLCMRRVDAKKMIEKECTALGWLGWVGLGWVGLMDFCGFGSKVGRVGGCEGFGIEACMACRFEGDRDGTAM